MKDYTIVMTKEQALNSLIDGDKIYLSESIGVKINEFMANLYLIVKRYNLKKKIAYWPLKINSAIYLKLI